MERQKRDEKPSKALEESTVETVRKAEQEEEQEEQERLSLGVKLKRGITITKRVGGGGGGGGGPSTPSPHWKFGPSPFPSPSAAGRHPRRTSNFSEIGDAIVSARKLGAGLWDVEGGLAADDMIGGRRRIHGHRRRGRRVADGLDGGDDGIPLEQTAGFNGLQRHEEASLMQHHIPSERNIRALQPVSPASYCSSLEVTAYNQVATPSSSLDFKGRLGESKYSLKTSTELLKVLNRIWTLEEQHASNVSLVKALKMELDHAQARIQELICEQHADRREIDDLLKQVAKEKMVRKSKEQDKINVAVQSMRDEFEDERRLRRRSESLHRKLAKELSEVKHSYAKAFNELEIERKARGLLEELCDEFAQGVGEYEQELRTLRNKSGKDCDRKVDRLILHISEAWLDERLQMKLAEARSDSAGKNTAVDRLRCEIESFLQTRHGNGSKTDNDACMRRCSLESVHLNGAGSAPQDAEDEDSLASDSRCFEIKDSNGNNCHDHLKIPQVFETQRQRRKSSPSKKKIVGRERMKSQSSCGLYAQYDEQIEGTKSHKVNKMHSQTDIRTSQKPERCEASEGDREINGSDHAVDDVIRRSSFCDGSEIYIENDQDVDSFGRPSQSGAHFAGSSSVNAFNDVHGISSPTQQWSYLGVAPDVEISQCSKLPKGVKENTLKAKLLEARLEGQCARLKSSKHSSVGATRG
ncbi:Uncharacterized protein QJS10_CPB22g00052 [Acorus calamus]|uniref:Uncharacterized protein n=1 Tax=Acorus calamus TaxID=4465 RepID=A0AAV9BZS0_ACOCL|nr:Uncharacterized protein QJS10_CPB22g00052 [Acorus calamus]